MKKEVLICEVAIFVFLMSACAAPATQPVPTVTSVPTETSTATPVSNWVTNFSEPILKAIADLPPAYQDDFSNPQSGWYVGRKETNLDPQSQATPPDPGKHIFGERGYIDGSYFTTADPFSCVNGRNSEMDAYRDFVAEFDVRFVSGTNGDWEFQFHNNGIGKYWFGKWIVGGGGFGKCSPHTDPECEGIANFGDNPTKGANDWNHLLLVVRNPRMAAYVNGVPILYYEDKAYTDDLGAGAFVFSGCSMVDTPMEIRWDNFKVWDISNLP